MTGQDWQRQRTQWAAVRAPAQASMSCPQTHPKLRSTGRSTPTDEAPDGSSLSHGRCFAPPSATMACHPSGAQRSSPPDVPFGRCRARQRRAHGQYDRQHFWRPENRLLLESFADQVQKRQPHCCRKWSAIALNRSLVAPDPSLWYPQLRRSHSQAMSAASAFWRQDKLPLIFSLHPRSYYFPRVLEEMRPGNTTIPEDANIRC